MTRMARPETARHSALLGSRAKVLPYDLTKIEIHLARFLFTTYSTEQTLLYAVGQRNSEWGERRFWALGPESDHSISKTPLGRSAHRRSRLVSPHTRPWSSTKRQSMLGSTMTSCLMNFSVKYKLIILSTIRNIPGETCDRPCRCRNPIALNCVAFRLRDR